MMVQNLLDIELLVDLWVGCVWREIEQRHTLLNGIWYFIIHHLTGERLEMHQKLIGVVHTEIRQKIVNCEKQINTSQ